MPRRLLPLACLTLVLGCATMRPAEPSPFAPTEANPESLFSAVPAGARLGPTAETSRPLAPQEWDPYGDTEYDPPPRSQDPYEPYEPYDPYDPYARRTLPVKRFAWDVWGMMGLRNTIGGDAEDVVEPSSPLFGFGTGPVIAVGAAQGIAPGMFFAYSPIEADDFDFGWDVSHLGFNFRYLFVYQPELSAYGFGDFSLTHWEGRGSDGLVVPNDLDGETFGFGAGVDFFVARKFSLGGQLAYHSYRGDFSTSAVWLDFVFVFQGRF